MSIRLSTFLVTLACAALVGCGGGSGSAGASKPAAGGAGGEIAVKALDTLKFDPTTITVKAGAPAKIGLANTGALEHNLVIDNLDGKKFELVAAPGKTNSAELPATKAGRYEFHCSIAGHTEAGMKGTLVVE